MIKRVNIKQEAVEGYNRKIKRGEKHHSFPAVPLNMTASNFFLNRQNFKTFPFQTE